MWSLAEAEAEDDRDLLRSQKLEIKYMSLGGPIPPSLELRNAYERARCSKNPEELLNLARKDFPADTFWGKDTLFSLLAENENSNQETIDIVAFYHYKPFATEIPKKVLKHKNASRKAIQKVARFALRGDEDYEGEYAKYHLAYQYTKMMSELCYHKYITTKLLEEFTACALKNEFLTECRYQLLLSIVNSKKVSSKILQRVTDLIVGNYRSFNMHDNQLGMTIEEELLIKILDSVKVTAKIISKIYNMRAENLKMWWVILDRIAGSELTSMEILYELATCRYPEVRRTLAKNAKIDKKIRGILVKDPDEQVKEIIAEDEQTPSEYLEILASDENYYVRYNVANNNSCTEEIFLIIIAKEEKHSEILVAIYDNHKASDKIKEKILSIWGIE